MQACIDIDGVIAKSLDLFLDIIPDLTDGRVNYKATDIKNWKMEDNEDALGNSITPEEFEKAHEIFSQRASEIEPMEGAVETLHDLALDFDIHFVTGRQHTTKETTAMWLREHGFPEHTLAYVERGQKQNYCMDADFFIEDDPLQAEICNDWGIPTLLFDQPYNQNSHINRIESWHDLINYI